MVISAVDTSGAVPPGIYTPTRWKGSNFSPTRAPWEFLVSQFRRFDFFAKVAMFRSASATAARNDSSALSEADISSAWVTANWPISSFAPSNVQ